MAIQILLTFLLLDLWRYWEHRLFHRAPWLWRLHLVHHSDTQLDVTTSERHHPLETLVGTVILMALVFAFGLPAAGIAFYLLVATVVSFCAHANLRLPASLDRVLRRIIVTPGTHAVHHSDLRSETDSNFGTVLTLWDRLFGSYADPDKAKIPHIGLEYFHQAKDTGLVRVLQQPFLLRSGMAYPERDDTGLLAAALPATPGLPLTPGWKNALLLGTAGCILASLVLWPTLLQLTAFWANNEAYQYAWLVVPMMVYLLAWEYRAQTLAINPQPGFTGVAVAAGAAAFWSIATLMNLDVGRHIALVIALQGIVMAMLGWRFYWRLFPILALLFLIIPSGDLLQPFLRMLTVKVIALFAMLANLPHSIEGFVVYIGNHRYVVVDECSGLPFVTLAIFLSYSFGLLLYRSIFKIMALTLFGAFLGIFSNALRVNAIVLIDWIQGTQMELTAHASFQWIALFMTLGLLFFVLSRLQADEPEVAPAAVSQEQTMTARRFAPVIAGLAVLVIIGSLMALPINAPRTPRSATAATAAPQQIAGWTLASTALNWTVEPRSQTESRNLAYRRDGKDMHVLTVETMSPNAKLSESWLAPEDRKTWREGRIQKQSACIASRCLTLTHSTWRNKGQELRHVFYTYDIGGFSTDSKLALRAAHGWHRLTGSGNSPRLIGLTFDGAAPAIEDVAAALLAFRSGLEAGSL